MQFIPFYALGEAGMGGWQWMVLDDVAESKGLEKQHQTNIIQTDDVCAVFGTAATAINIWIVAGVFG